MINLLKKSLYSKAFRTLVTSRLYDLCINVLNRLYLAPVLLFGSFPTSKFGQVSDRDFLLDTKKY